MRKIGIAALTLLATAACAESPVGIHADGTRAARNGGAVEAEGYVQEDGVNAGDPEVAPIGEDPGLTLQENPGLGLSGN